MSNTIMQLGESNPGVKKGGMGGKVGNLISNFPPGVGQLILMQIKSPLNPDIPRMGGSGD